MNKKGSCWEGYSAKRYEEKRETNGSKLCACYEYRWTNKMV